MSQPNRAAWVVVLAATGLAMGRAWADSPAYQYEALAYLGTSAPGGGTLAGAFQPGAVGNDGSVAYVAAVSPEGAMGLFLDTTDGAFALAGPGMNAAEGWQFAIAPGALGGIASPVSMNADGDLVFSADLTRGDQTGAGTFLWTRSSGALTAVALPGQSMPGAALLGNASAGASLADNGEVAFAGDLRAGSGAGATGVFVLNQGRISLVAGPGDAEPGGGAFLSAGWPSVNDRGAVAFLADVSRSGPSTSGIFLGSGSRTTRVVETGMPAPGGGVFRAVGEPRLNNHGELVFFGDTSDAAVYLAQAGQLTRLAGPGSLLPGGDRAGAVVAGAGSMALNQLGAVALVLKPQDSPAPGIFVALHDDLWPVALPGSILAGIGPLDSVGPDVALNDQGQVAFQANLSDGDVALVLASPLLSTEPN